MEEESKFIEAENQEELITYQSTEREASGNSTIIGIYSVESFTPPIL